MTTAAMSLVGAAIAAGVLVLASVRARRRAALRVSAALARLVAQIDELSAEIAAALEKVRQADRLARALGEPVEWLEPADVAARAADAAAELASADASLVRARDASGNPLVATVALTLEKERPDAFGWPPGGTRAVALDFLDTSDAEFRSGLAVPIDGDGDPPSFLAVFWRDPCDADDEIVRDLEALAARTRLLLDRDGSPPVEEHGGRDELTGLAGRLAFHEALTRQVTRARNGDGRFALILVDVDDFRSLNERIGQLAGDAVLIELANHLRESAGEAAVGGRIGGDRFALILPQGTYADAEQVFARLQAGLRQRRPAGPYRLALSGGIAMLEDGEDPLVVFERAGEALHRAKGLARGSAVVARAGNRDR